MTPETRTTHTPGPWRYEEYVNGSRILDANGKPISIFNDPVNGRLIASAPELLEALIATTILLKAVLDDPSETVAMATAAIAKATQP